AEALAKRPALAAGEVRSAGGGVSVAAHLRGDASGWFGEGDGGTEALVLLRARVQSAVLALGVVALAGDELVPSRVQVAEFPPGGCFKRHRDNPNRNGRIVTAVYYANEGWADGDGGALRLHLGAGAGHVDVLPRLDTLVLFKSAAVPHEVLPARRARLAATVWIESRAERDRSWCSQKPEAALA
ncbi:unnamed protein product, partial [Prorocentrum cordatum]